MRKLESLPSLAKAGVIIGGYGAAFAIAFGIVAIYVDLTSGPDREASSGMYAYGDSLLFLVLFALLSVVPTVLALFMMRNSRVFWLACVVIAAGIAAASLLSVAVIATYSSPGEMGVTMTILAALAIPLIFVSPFLAASFGLSALIAREASFRWLLGGAAAMECVSAFYGFFHFFVRMFLR